MPSYGLGANPACPGDPYFNLQKGVLDAAVRYKP
jgi:hypothetical protein